MTLKKGLLAMIVVGLAFTTIGIGLAWGAFYVFFNQSGRSTGLMGLVAFGWALLAMVISMVLALPTGVASGQAHARVGIVTVETHARRGGQLATTITGPGAEVLGTTDITVRSRAPSVFLYISAAGLAATTITLYAIGRTTLMGLGVGMAMAYFNANWGKQARPQPPLNDQALSSTWR